MNSLLYTIRKNIHDNILKISYYLHFTQLYTYKGFFIVECSDGDVNDVYHRRSPSWFVRYINMNKYNHHLCHLPIYILYSISFVPSLKP